MLYYVIERILGFMKHDNAFLWTGVRNNNIRNEEYQWCAVLYGEDPNYTKYYSPQLYT